MRFARTSVLSDSCNALVNLLGRVRYGDRVAYLRNDLEGSRSPEFAFLAALPAATIVAEMSEAVSATQAAHISGNLAKGGKLAEASEKTYALDS